MRLLLVKDDDKNFKLSKKALMLSSVSYANAIRVCTRLFT